MKGCFFMEVKFKKISVCEYNRHSQAKAPVDADVIVPDKNDDIYRILSVTAVPDVSERYIRKDKMIFSGNVKFNILYVGESDRTKITAIECVTPFNHQCDVPGVDEDASVFTSCSVCNTKYEIKNSRKLSVGVHLNFDINAYNSVETDVICADELDDSYPSKTSVYECDELKICKEFELECSDTVTASSNASTCEVYSISVNPDITEIKTVNNKAVVKGNADVAVLYSADGELSSCNSEISFTEIVDIDSVSAEHTIVYSFEPSDYSASAQCGDNSIQFDVRFKIRGVVCAYEHCRENLVTDIYSPDYKYELTQSQYSINKLEAMRRHQFTVKDSLNIDGFDSSSHKIQYMNSHAAYTSSRIESNRIIIEGKVENDIIYTDGAGVPSSIHHTSPFETELPCDDINNNSDLSIHLMCAGSGYAFSSSAEILLRAIIKIDLSANSTQKLSLISGFKADTDLPADKSGQPSIVVCYPNEEIELWDYAKKYNTTVDEIKKVNSLDDHVTTVKSGPLIIPKRQTNR